MAGGWPAGTNPDPNPDPDPNPNPNPYPNPDPGPNPDERTYQGATFRESQLSDDFVKSKVGTTYYLLLATYYLLLTTYY